MSLRAILVLAAVAAAVLGVSASSASAATFYMSNAGSDTGDCATPATACGSFFYVDQVAGQTSGPHTVHVAAGGYETGYALYTPNVTWEGPQAGVPAPGRTGPEARVLVNPYESGLQIVSSGITFDGFTFQSAFSEGVYGLRVFSDVVVRNTRFSDLVTGIATDQGGTVTGSEFDTTGDAFVSAGGTNVSSSVFRAGPSAAGIRMNGGAVVATGNTFSRGAYGIVASALRATATGNRFTPAVPVGVYSGGVAVDAKNNWWGCNGGPGASGCSQLAGPGAGASSATPYLTLTGSVAPTAVPTGGDAEVRATLNVNSAGQDVGPQLVGTSVTFATDGGTLAQPTAAIGADGIARDTLTAPGTGGTLSPSVALDNASVSLSLDVTPALSIDPAEKDFGSAWVGGSSSTIPFTVTNTTSDPITIHAVGLQGDDTDDFVVFGQGCRTTLAAGASCTVSVALRPMSAGGKTAQLAIIPEGSPTAFTAALAGGGVIDDTIDVTPTSLGFGAVSVGGASPRQSVTVTNNGTDPLPITAITTTGDSADFVVSAGGCRRTLAAGTSCSFTSSFRPDAEGARSATVTIRSTGHPARTVSMAGTGVAAALTITPEGANYGTVRVGSNTRQLFTITNNGATAGPVIMGAIKLGGTDAASYALYAGSCANHLLAVGDSCQISAYLRPATAGTKTAQITISATGQPARTIDLSGSATA
jgi:hypothetical protein